MSRRWVAGVLFLGLSAGCGTSRPKSTEPSQDATTSPVEQPDRSWTTYLINEPRDLLGGRIASLPPLPADRPTIDADTALGSVGLSVDELGADLEVFLARTTVRDYGMIQGTTLDLFIENQFVWVILRHHANPGHGGACCADPDSEPAPVVLGDLVMFVDATTGDRVGGTWGGPG